ncbi:MAG: hypothetical protein KKD07_09965 [Candidatus Omnitrophica bacterium]|nr:hypothetical protein [Candidatus Omnitrophota bacterium]MBU1997049.1 hypothetical protein [Candidatus Omnitrophota bacterium]MBU4334752.1 hypothetical protein [Candidatus Omnitrophota bacterium]
MMEYKCDLCKKSISGGVLPYSEHVEDHIMELIKARHPDWVETDGICKKCYEYYKNELRGK